MSITSADQTGIHRFSSETIRWQDGDTSKSDPFFILVINSIAIERPWGSGIYKPDMNGSGLASSDNALFERCAEYLYKSVFGKLPGQAEKMLSRSPHASKVRFHSIFVCGLLVDGGTALVGEELDSGSGLLKPRRAAVCNMLAYLGVNPDVVFVVTNSPTNKRASAIPASDNMATGGVATTYDGKPFLHCYRHRIPGMAAIHATDSIALTGAHEFGHAFSSFPNAYIADLYVDGEQAFNRKVGRPIPEAFAYYGMKQFATDKARDSLGYPSQWQSYHCQLEDANNPALMDNFWSGQPSPMACKNDWITTKFMLDRLAAKVAR
ncbi:hypothetical protein [Massilia sp. erpn]|uniref:hypothetical protein n=1 Tax=Massilia sp. erpn TaxID=2738142 RepID=UPI002103234A|nr:hypothetical protein [Massilia sp. erpn]UTY60486.1 hypothetical protein HPQ68_26800 [Massilia sp. erpn]